MEAPGFTEAVQGIALCVLPREVLAYHYLLIYGIPLTRFALNLIKLFYPLLVSCPVHSFCPSFSVYTSILALCTSP